MYSQHGEDVIAWTFFQNINTPSGFYVDVGAGDGERFSNTLLLEQRGWNGVLIEPDPRSASRCRITRQVAIASGKTRLYELACLDQDSLIPAPFYLAAYPEMSTLDISQEAAIAAFSESQGVPHSMTATEVRVITLTSLLKTIEVNHIDLLKVDTEWRNAEALRGMDFNLWQPRLVIAEANPIEWKSVLDVMNAAGYMFFVEHYNYFFVRTLPDQRILNDIVKKWREKTEVKS